MLTIYLGVTIATAGKLLLGLAVWRVHAFILAEHRIDNVVLQAIRRERYITLAGILCILAGYTLEMAFYANAPFTGF